MDIDDVVLKLTLDWVPGPGDQMHPNVCLFLPPLECYLFEAFGLKNTSAESFWKAMSLDCFCMFLYMGLFYLILFNEANLAHLPCKQRRLRTCFGFSHKRILAKLPEISPQNCPEQMVKECKAVFKVLMVLDAIGGSLAQKRRGKCYRFFASGQGG